MPVLACGPLHSIVEADEQLNCSLLQKECPCQHYCMAVLPNPEQLLQCIAAAST